MATEKEDLDQFVRSQGWLRFKQHVEKDWDARFQALVRQAITGADDQINMRKLQQVMVAKDAIEQLLKWPTERLSELERAEQGRLAAEHIPMQRGGL